MVSVAICTWNRSTLLDRTLIQFRSLRIPNNVEWELLIVNNNSPDDTDIVIARHAAEEKLPIRRLFEPKQGQSHARNCAITAARGELILWTDDDVLVDVDWLVQYWQAANAFPEASYFGGTVDPWFEAPPQGWVQQNLTSLLGVYAIRQLGTGIRIFVDLESPIGANMAFRTKILHRYYFHTDVGHQGDRLIGGDETQIFEKMRADNLVGIWVGSARVEHFIPKTRMSIAYLWRWFHGRGVCESRLDDTHGAAVAMIFGVPRFAIRLYLSNLFWFLLLYPFKTQAWFQALCIAAKSAGVISEYRARHRNNIILKE